MAVAGAPTGRKLSKAAAPSASGGRPRGLLGTRRTKLPLKGGNPSGRHASLISGAQVNGKKGGD